MNWRNRSLAVGAIAFLSIACSSMIQSQERKVPFTIADEIGLTYFSDPNGAPAEIHFSPDGNYFVTWTERGDRDEDCVHDSLTFYRVRDTEQFLEHSSLAVPPPPIWVVDRCTDKQGPIISHWHWLADSSGVAYLERVPGGKQHLTLADLSKKTVVYLTSLAESVGDFDVQDREHYVYTVSRSKPEAKRAAERSAAAVVGTNRGLFDLILPDAPVTAMTAPSKTFLWAEVGGRRFEVKQNDEPLASFGSFALSPDGKSLVTALPVSEVPKDWETLYPPPYESDANGIHAGHNAASQYVLLDIETGSAQPLTNAPLGDDADWWWGGNALGDNGPKWSSDGKNVLLAGTFVETRDNSPSRPCVAVVEVATKTAACVEILKKRNISANTFEEGYRTIMGAEFVRGDGHRVRVNFLSHEDQSFDATEYSSSNGSWQATAEIKGSGKEKRNGLEVAVTQGLNESPKLVASNKQSSKVVLDPNPQLREIDLGEASVYTWTDRDGKQWRGGLYKPVGYQTGHRYPLVIQTHGFSDSEFRPSGVFPTAFAARALAAEGIMVLQTVSGVNGANCPSQTSEEMPCVIDLYESAEKKLVADGLVDPERVGAIGFSRTCLYVMKSLVTESFSLKAASVTDGVMADYWQFVLLAGGRGDASALIGAKPIGEGLQTWLKDSAAFNLDKTNTPLMVVGEGRDSLMSMWQPYAVLHYLHKPVDLIMLNTNEHVLTNPAVRYASQQGSVDWFRFWLQGYEDPDPSKAEQYKRWRGLTKMRADNDAKQKDAKDKSAIVN
jgi:dipeptidyl aminopeptidase/acylaminoacyl peptidase